MVGDYDCSIIYFWCLAVRYFRTFAMTEVLFGNFWVDFGFGFGGFGFLQVYLFVSCIVSRAGQTRDVYIRGYFRLGRAFSVCGGLASSETKRSKLTQTAGNLHGFSEVKRRAEMAEAARTRAQQISILHGEITRIQGERKLLDVQEESLQMELAVLLVGDLLETDGGGDGAAPEKEPAAAATEGNKGEGSQPQDRAGPVLGFSPSHNLADARAEWDRLCSEYKLYEPSSSPPKLLTPRNNQLPMLLATMQGKDVVNVDAPGNGKTVAYIVCSLWLAEVRALRLSELTPVANGPNAGGPATNTTPDAMVECEVAAEEEQQYEEEPLTAEHIEVAALPMSSNETSPPSQPAGDVEMAKSDEEERESTKDATAAAAAEDEEATGPSVESTPTDPSREDEQDEHQPVQQDEATASDTVADPTAMDEESPMPTLPSGSVPPNSYTVVVQPTIDLMIQQQESINSILGLGAAVMVDHSFKGPYTPKKTGYCGDSNQDSGANDEPSAVSISSFFEQPDEHSFEGWLLKTNSAQFILCLANDLDTPQFRGCLQALSSVGRMNNFVVDESHLVEQWGGSFHNSLRDLSVNSCLVLDGLLTNNAAYQRPQVQCLTGTASTLQAEAMAEEMGLLEDSTEYLYSSLDRPNLYFDFLDLHYVDGPKAKVLLEGARRMIPEVVEATRSIIFVATTEDAEKVAKYFNKAKCGINAYPFYSRLDAAAACDEQKLNRDCTLTEWQKYPHAVLVSTTLGVHGLNYRNVDFVGHLMIPTDVRTYWQAANRACRDQQNGRAVMAISAEFIQDAAWMVSDWSDGARVAAFRQMLRIVGNGKSCRRAEILKALGSIPPIAGACSNCAACDPERSRNAPDSKLCVATRACAAVISHIVSRRAVNKTTPYAGTLRGSWRAGCRSTAEANAAFFYLCQSGVLDFQSHRKRGMEVVVNGEQAAPIVCHHSDIVLRVTDAP